MQRAANILAINLVLYLDLEASKASNGSISFYSTKIRGIDISQCPNDFATAYIDYIHAWEYAVKIQRANKALEDDDGAAVLKGLVATMTGSEQRPFADHVDAKEEIKQQAHQASDEINRTARLVQRVAVSYGAKLPK